MGDGSYGISCRARLHAGWCGKEECELKVKEETGADIRVIPFNQEELEKEELEKCVFCGSKSEKKVIFARAY